MPAVTSESFFPPPRVIGHRGAAMHAPENTVAGFRAAAAMGARWVEFDVQVTRDDCPILLHDARLERTTNGRGIAADLTANALAGLDAGGWFGTRFRGERLPRLDEALSLLDALRLGAVIEIKAPRREGPRTMRAALAALRACGRREATVLSSFDEDAVALARDQAPEIPRALIVKTVPRDWRVRAERLGLSALHVDQRTLDRATVAAVAERMPLRAYTVNAPDRAQTLFVWGADAVFTDCPDVISSADGHQRTEQASAGSRGS